MSYSTFPTSVPGPSFPVDKQKQPKIKKVSFGDGYTQQAPDGINYSLAIWNLSWDALTTAEKTTIENFLESMGGYQTFQWTDQTATLYLVKCDQWTVSNFEPSTWKISATFTQVPI